LSFPPSFIGHGLLPRRKRKNIDILGTVDLLDLGNARPETNISNSRTRKMQPQDLVFGTQNPSFSEGKKRSLLSCLFLSGISFFSAEHGHFGVFFTKLDNIVRFLIDSKISTI
jgi:hypothetical protein